MIVILTFKADVDLKQAFLIVPNQIKKLF